MCELGDFYIFQELISLKLSHLWVSQAVQAAVQTGQCINNSNGFLTVAGAGSLRSRCQQGGVRSCTSQTSAFFLCSHLVEGAGDCVQHESHSWGFQPRDLSPI